MGWFPLGPREVFVPSYPVSRVYVNNVNISNTTVNQTVINNYYNTTVVNKNVTVNNVQVCQSGCAGRGDGYIAACVYFRSASGPESGRREASERLPRAPAVVRAPAIVPPKQAVLGAGVATMCIRRRQFKIVPWLQRQLRRHRRAFVRGTAGGHSEKSGSAAFHGASATTAVCAIHTRWHK